jgi:hypothetical protein
MTKRYLFLALFLPTLLLIFTTSLPLNAGKLVTGQQSLQERGLNAAQQMREYRQRTGIESKNNKLRTLSALPQGPTIRIDKTFKTSSLIFFHDDMESGTGTWTTTAYAGTDLFHLTTIKANSAVTSWWSGIEAQNNYNNGQRVSNALQSAPVDLTTATGPVKLLFTENYMTEAGWDFCMVDVSTDGGATWTPLRGGYGDAPSGDSQGWILTTLDLTPYIGNSVIIRFYFETYDEKFNEFPGWFVDNVVLFDQGGMITGKTFFDVNNNGLKDSTDSGVKDWLVTATGTGDAAGITISTLTNYRGKFWLPLPLGTYTITDEIKEGWVQTFPSPFPSQLTISTTTPDTLVDSTWFGNFTNASFINGKVFNDVDKNGIYDPLTDSLLIGWRVILSDTLGNLVDYDFTDSLGVYQLFVLSPGRYIISEAPGKLNHGWVESYPTSETYTVEIPDLSTVLNDMDFGNYFSPLTNAVIGQAFNDRNRNQFFDTDELGALGFTIHLIVRDTLEGNIIYNRKRVTDSSGYYQFMGVPSGNCEISELIGPKNVGWWLSAPFVPYTLPLSDGETLDSVDFGNYEIAPSSITGVVFNDLDTSGTKESGEEGLNNWTIQVNGISIYNTSMNLSATSGPDGQFTVGGLWPGQYTVSEVFRTNWRQTYPTNFKSHNITLDVEQTQTDINFGNVYDGFFSLAFRTFPPESLALAVDAKNKHNPIKLKPDKVEFSFGFINNEPSDSIIRKLVFFLSVTPTDTLQIKPWGIQIRTKNKIEVTFPNAIDSTDTVEIYGWIPKAKLVNVTKWWWIRESLRKTTLNIAPSYGYSALRYPMPNAINALFAGAGTNIKVGLGGPHTVLHKTYKDIQKSLLDGHGMHIGDPRCLGVYANSLRSIKSQIRNLPPTKGNNRLFAEAVALQVNIKASDMGLIPGGLGNLIFDDGGTNPLNGKSIREVGAVLDQYMSSYKDSVDKKHCEIPAGYEALDSIGFYNIIRMINSAFSGPIDTTRWIAGGLEFKAVRPLSEVSFLRLDSSFAQMGSSISQYPETSIPDRFTLSQNYPNPFNPSTMIEFYLPEESFVTLKIYNTLGQEVATLIDHQDMDWGTQEVELSSQMMNLSSGIYYYRLIAQSITEDGELGQKFVETKKMILLK